MIFLSGQNAKNGGKKRRFFKTVEKDGQSYVRDA